MKEDKWLSLEKKATTKELGQISAKPREKTECFMGSFKDIAKLLEGM